LKNSNSCNPENFAKLINQLLITPNIHLHLVEWHYGATSTEVAGAPSALHAAHLVKAVIFSLTSENEFFNRIDQKQTSNDQITCEYSVG